MSRLRDNRWVKAGDWMSWGILTAAAIGGVLADPMQWKPIVAALILMFGWNSAVSAVEGRRVIKQTEDEGRLHNEKKERD